MKLPVLLLAVSSVIFAPAANGVFQGDARAAGEEVPVSGAVFSVTGRVEHLDKTPQAHVVVQAVRLEASGESGGRAGETDGINTSGIAATALTGLDGGYDLGRLPPGEYRVRCHGWGEFIEHPEPVRFPNPEADTRNASLPHREAVARDFRFASFRKGNWKVYSSRDGQGILVDKLYAIEQSPDGFLWMASALGVARFDGAKFEPVTHPHQGPRPGWVRTIKKAPDETMWVGEFQGDLIEYVDGDWRRHPALRALQPGVINAIEFESEDVMWIGTSRGLAFGRKAQTGFGTEWSFEGARFDDRLATNAIHVVLPAPDGAVWVGSSAGLFRCRPLSSASGPAVLEHFTEQDGLAATVVSSLAIDARQRLWIGTWGGVSYGDLDQAEQTGFRFRKLTSEEGLLGGDVRCISPAPDGSCWFGIWGAGVSRFDGKTLVHYRGQDIGEGAGLEPRVVSFFRDEAGWLWMATDFSGFWRFDPDSLTTFDARDGVPSTGGTILARDPNGVLWTGNWHGTSGGLARWQASRAGSFVPRSHPEGNVTGICWDAKGGMWIGVYGAGLYREREGQWEKRGDAHLLMPLFRDRHDAIWAGSVFNGAYRFSRGQTDVFREELPGQYVNAIQEGPDGAVWLAVTGLRRSETGGLMRFEDGRFSMAVSGDTNNRGFTALAFDPDGRIWAGSSSSLFCFDTNGVKQFTAQDGVPQSLTQQMAANADGSILAATWAGLLRFDGTVWSSLDTRDGLRSDTLFSVLPSENSEIWFGGLGGAYRYRPTSTQPAVRLLEIQGDDTVTDFTEPPRLFTGRPITFRFDAIDFKTAPDKRRFRCRIEPGTPAPEELDAGPGSEARRRHWSKPFLGTTFQTVFRRPGVYTFAVQTIDRDLNYSKPVAVTLRVVAPWHANPWLLGPGIGAFFLLGGTSVYFGLRSRAQQRRLRFQEEQSHAALESKHAELLAAHGRLHELDELKSEFVANVSHEFRTPLTAIRAALENMLDGITGAFNPKQARYLARIRANTERLSRLIHDLLDLSKIEAGRICLNPARVVVGELAAEVIESVAALSEEKGVRVVLEVNPALAVQADPDRLHQVLLNLMANALKFTPPGGTIRVSAERQDAQVVVSVADTGEGIPAGQIERVFERFHQAGGAASARSGAGIGLAIAKGLVELHGGRIWVRSSPGAGSIFSFTLPAP